MLRIHRTLHTFFFLCRSACLSFSLSLSLTFSLSLTSQFDFIYVHTCIAYGSHNCLHIDRYVRNSSLWERNRKLKKNIYISKKISISREGRKDIKRKKNIYQQNCLRLKTYSIPEAHPFDHLFTCVHRIRLWQRDRPNRHCLSHTTSCDCDRWWSFIKSSPSNPQSFDHPSRCAVLTFISLCLFFYQYFQRSKTCKVLSFDFVHFGFIFCAKKKKKKRKVSINQWFGQSWIVF